MKPLIALALLLLVATSAAAGEAWVLWMDGFVKIRGETSTRWKPLGAYETLAACEAERMEVYAYQLAMKDDPQYTVTLDGNSVVHTHSSGAYGRFRYVCLPDTVNPR